MIPSCYFSNNIAAKGNNKRNNQSNNNYANKKPKTAREEIQELTQIVKEFNSKSFDNKNKNIYQQDKLTKLGCIPLKQQKMPTNMRIGLLKAKQKREKRINIELKESKVVTNNNKLSNKSKVSRRNK